jgi:formate hydrogenlyase subunit 3/multisubunit Na+/H+ antiporter MnhD subunit
LALLGALFIFSQRNFGRSMGYVHLVETGALLLALGLGTETGLEIAIWGLMVHGLAMSAWGLSLDDIQRTEAQPHLADDFTPVQGLGRRRPFVTATLLVSLLSMVGFPLTAGFTARWALLHELAHIHPTAALLLLSGTASLGVLCARGLAALLRPEPDAEIAETSPLVVVRRLLREPPSAIGVYGLCLGGLLLVGLFPQWFVTLAHWAAQIIVSGEP